MSSPPSQDWRLGNIVSNDSQVLTGAFQIQARDVFFGSSDARKSQPPTKLLSTLPFHQNPDFVNRGDTLTEIDKRCSRPGGRAALVGLGGVGKSQLAIEYFFNVREKPQRIQVFWVYGSSTAKFVAAYKDIADKLQLPGRDDSTANMLHLVHNWLCSEDSGRWFMVLDNADDKNLFFPQEHSAASKGSVSSIKLADFLPKSQNGSILITSRNRDLARKLTGRDNDVLEIQQMSLDEGLSLLQNKLSRPDKPVVELRSGPDSEPAKALLAALGYMPLAISQAAAYITQRYPPVTIQGYLQQFHDSDERREELLTRESLDLCREEGASNSILATYQISFEYIHEERRPAADLLAFMSFFSPQGIPGFMIWNHFDGNADAEDGRNRRHRIDSDLAFLIDFSLVATNPDGDTFVMHPLVQFATRTWLKSLAIEGRVRQNFLAALSTEFPNGAFETWSQCQLLLPHVEPWVNMQLTNNEDAACWTKVMKNAASYLKGRGLYTQAESMARRSWITTKQVFGINHPYTLINAQVLASVLYDRGSLEQAEQILQGLLNLRKDWLDCRNDLGLVLMSRGRHKEAERLFRQVSKEYELTQGKKNPSTLAVLTNLAATLKNLGKYGEAEQMIRQVLEDEIEVLGEEHPNTIKSMQILASILSRQGRYQESEQMFQRVLEDREKILGPDHPYTLRAVACLAAVKIWQGRYDSASKMFQKALDGFERNLGPYHELTIMSRNELETLARVICEQEELLSSRFGKLNLIRRFHARMNRAIGKHSATR